jgi:hypothetical protein
MKTFINITNLMLVSQLFFQVTHSCIVKQEVQEVQEVSWVSRKLKLCPCNATFELFFKKNTHTHNGNTETTSILTRKSCNRNHNCNRN